MQSGGRTDTETPVATGAVYAWAGYAWADYVWAGYAWAGYMLGQQGCERVR